MKQRQFFYAVLSIPFLLCIFGVEMSIEVKPNEKYLVQIITNMNAKIPHINNVSSIRTHNYSAQSRVPLLKYIVLFLTYFKVLFHT